MAGWLTSELQDPFIPMAFCLNLVAGERGETPVLIPTLWRRRLRPRQVLPTEDFRGTLFFSMHCEQLLTC